MRHTSPEAPEDPLTPEEPDTSSQPAPAPVPELETELEPPLVALHLSEGTAPDGIEPLDASGKAISRLARSLARSALASMGATSRPLSEEAKMEIHRQIEEIWDRA